MRKRINPILSKARTGRSSLFAIKMFTGFIFIILFFAYLLNYTFEHQEDLIIFLSAGEAIKQSLNPYDETSNRYVYGPLLSIIISSILNLEISVIKIGWFLMNSVSIGGIVLLVNSFRHRHKLEKIEITYLSFFLLSSFSFRNSVAQGQVVTQLVFFCLLALYLSETKEVSTFKAYIIGLILLPVLEIKPYMILSILVLFSIRRQFRIIFGLFLVMIGFNVMYLFCFQISYIDWFETLAIRLMEVDGGYDQASLQGVLENSLGLTDFFRLLFYLIFLFIVMGWLIVNRRFFDSHNKRIALALVLPSLVSPFLHSHDILFALVGFLLAYKNEMLSNFFSRSLFLVILALHVNWTSENLIAGVFLQLTLLLATYLHFSRYVSNKGWALLGTCMALSLFVGHSWFSGGYTRIYVYNLSSFIYACMLFCALSSIRQMYSEGTRQN